MRCMCKIMFAWWKLVLFRREKSKFSSPVIKRPLFFQTGTLTEEGLDVWGVMEGGPDGFSEMVPDPRLLPHGHMLSGLACCHTVTLFKDQPLGDPLELKMTESTGWVWNGNLTWFLIKPSKITHLLDSLLISGVPPHLSMKVRFHSQWNSMSCQQIDT